MSYVERRYLAAPGAGLVAEDDAGRKSGTFLADRIANGEALPGERVIRVPRRFFRCRFGFFERSFWSLKNELGGRR